MEMAATEKADKEERLIEQLHNDTVETLEFNHDDVGVMTAYAVCTQLCTKPNITSLSLCNLNLEYNAMKMIVDVFVENTTVQSLSLNVGYSLRKLPNGVHPWNLFLMRLSQCQSLTTLDLRCNGNFPNANDGLCFLLRNARLQNLSLSYWHSSLNEALWDNTSLCHLHLDRFYNTVTLSDFVPALIHARCTLQSLSFGFIACDEDSLKRLAEYYKNPDTYCLQKLDLSRANTFYMDYEELHRLFHDVMEHNTTLAVVVRSDGDINSDYVKHSLDLLAQQQRQMQKEMPKAAHVAVVRAYTE